MFDWLPKRIAAVQSTDKAREEGWRFVLNPPASEEEIRQCETTVGLPLPPSYRTFLSRWDGASIFRRELRLPDGRLDIATSLEVVGTGRLPGLTAGLREEIPVHPEDWDQLIAVADTPLGSGDHCFLNPERATTDGEYAIVDGWHEQSPRCWRRAVIAPSFEEWLQQAFEAAVRTGHPYYWLNSPELQALYRECHEEDQRNPSPVRPQATTTVVVTAVRHVSLRRDDE